MTPSDLNAVWLFVDVALETWRQTDLMRLPHPAMPVEMQDQTRAAESDWIPWKPIPSTVTEQDVQELEGKMKLRYPDLYKALLCHKHFYEFWPEREVNFFSHGIYEWKDTLLRAYFNAWDPAKLIARGYVCFADYSDWGIICFDTNHQRAQDNDCPIVLIDHELLYDEPLSMEMLYPSFADMMHRLRAAQTNPRQPEE